MAVSKVDSFPALQPHCSQPHVRQFLLELRLPAGTLGGDAGKAAEVLGACEHVLTQPPHQSLVLLAQHERLEQRCGTHLLCLHYPREEALDRSGPAAAAGAAAGGQVVLRAFLHQDLVTLDIVEIYLGDHHEGSGTIMTASAWNELGAALAGAVAGKLQLLPPILRGGRFNPYVPTTDNHLIQYDYVETVFEADSPYQNIKIMRSQQFGNMLLLDDDPNLAESDLAYTLAITGNGRYAYQGKDVLILGGGDGGILHELRKQNPKSIVMLEIDEIVVTAATKHLRGICYDSMDKLEGDNYKIILQDCVPILKEYAEKGRKFDFIINDLTAVPVSSAPREGDAWAFLRLILDLSMKVLADDGFYITQGNGKNNVLALAEFEKILRSLPKKVDFSKEEVTVPSYHEQWMFYTVWLTK